MADFDQPSTDASGDFNAGVITEHKIQDLKLGFSEDEEALIARMYSLIGERWSLIAGRIPGRTAEEIEKYCTSRKIILHVRQNCPAQKGELCIQPWQRQHGNWTRTLEKSGHDY